MTPRRQPWIALVVPFHLACTVEVSPARDWRDAELEGSSGAETGGLTTDDVPEPDPYPESDECGYVRPIRGDRVGVALLGPPVLEQNNCSAGKLCGRPGLDTCTPTDRARFTCGCVPIADACAPVALASGLDASDWQTREGAEARAIECCRGAEPDGFLSGLATAIDALPGNPSEAAERFGRIGPACYGSCSAIATWSADDAADGIYQFCEITKDTCHSTRSANKGWPPECQCSCASKAK